MDIPFPKDITSTGNALFLEHHILRIINKQEQTGVQFDTKRGEFYIRALQKRKEWLYKAIRPHLSMEVGVPYDRPISKPFKRDGNHTANVLKWFGEGGLPDIGGPFTRVRFTEPDLSKRARITTQLIRLGWKPMHFTDKGHPKITFEGEPCPSLGTIDGDIGRNIQRWYIYRHREGQIQGFVDAVRSDGRISASAITIGTPTFRFRHRLVVNLPRTGTEYGTRIRSLFTASEGRVLVGHDAKGLELRTLAHYINDPKFTEEVVNGDPHTKNQRDAGLPTRDDAKTFIYAFIYGARDAKLGSIVGKGRTEGARLRRQFLRANPKLAELVEQTKRASTRGYLIGLDGRKITLRRDKFTRKVQTYKGLNTLNQTAGAVVMKWSMYLLDKWVRDMGLDVWKIIDMHDEAQADVLLKDVEIYSALAKQSVVQAGTMLNLNVPLDADVKVGATWAETH